MTKVDDGSNCDESSCIVSCQPGWEREGDYCYFWSEERKHWFDVEDTCISIGGHLPSIDTWDINNYMMRTKISEWTGASDLSKEGEKKEKLGEIVRKVEANEEN